MLKILIVEDELLISEDIRMQLIQLGYEVTGQAVSYMEGIESIMNDLPDLVLVDIHISGNKDGIEFGKFLQEEAEIPFIYLTSHADKATVLRAKATQPDAYLLKPFLPENLYASIEVALAGASKRSMDFISNKVVHPTEQGEELFLKDCLFVKVDNSFVKINIQEIKFINAIGNYLSLYTQAKTKYVIRSSVKSIQQYLPEHDFFQTHKSHIINLKYLEKFSNESVTVDGVEIPLAKSRKDFLMSRMRLY